MPNNNREWLKRCFNCMEPVDTPDAKCAACGWDNHDRENGEAALEQTILKDQYILGKCLGRGGFGITYVGFDIALERRVAIKEYFPVGTAYRFSDGVTIRAYTKSEEDYQSGLNQALQESRTIAKLGQIPNVMQVYNVFLENGTVYMVMEYIDGISLADEVKQNGKLNWKDALHRLYPIMDALEKIHAKGMIHRDISPENIIRRNETGEPVLLDFGSARQPKKGLTVTLKPGYAPAEQYSQNGAQDGRVDEYALCATIYYLLTGSAPASADLRLFAKKDLKRPSEYADDIPAEIEEVLLKGMELNSSDRYPSVKDLHHALLKAEQEAGKARKPVKPSAPKPPKPQKPQKPETVPETGKKNGLLMKIAAIAIAAAVGCLIGFLFFGNAGRNKNVEQEADASSAQGSADETEGNEAVEPENDETPAPQPTATNTPAPEPTATNTPAPEPTATNTPTPEPTATNTPTPAPTATNTPTPAPTATNTPTPAPTATNTPTPAPTATNTPTPAPTATNTPTPAPTATNTPTPLPTATPVPAESPEKKAITEGQSALYPDGVNVSFTPTAYNEAAPDWTEYDNLIAEIKSETDTEARLAKMHQAEDLLMATGAVVPIYYYNDLYLQKTDVEGIYSNLFGFKYFQFATVPRDVLKVNLASEPAKIDPALNSSVDGACIDVNLFAGLYTYDEEGNLQPDLADHDNPYEVSDDGLVYTFHLQDGLKWSDGSDLTANDFVYAWKRAADPVTLGDYYYMFESIAGYEDYDLQVEAPDDLTLVVTLKAPCAYFLDLVAFPAYLPVPQAQVEAAPDWEYNPGSWASEAGFVTNGAYTVSEWTHDESMTLKKNPYYYRADEVTIEEIDFMLSYDDAAIYAAYQAGDLDFTDTVPTNEVEVLKESEDFHTVDNLGTYYVAFNVNSPIFEGKTVDQAIAMRKAFSLLIDRDYIIENISQTEQKVATSYIPEGMADGNGGVFKVNSNAYTYPNEEAVGYYPAEWSEEGVEEARALLEYAGFKFTEDGVLSDETPINITYLTNESTGHVAIAEAMQMDFSELGINMSIEQREWNVFLDERKNGQFDFARGGWLADFNDPINMLEMWTTDSGNNNCRFGKDPNAAPVQEAE